MQGSTKKFVEGNPTPQLTSSCVTLQLTVLFLNLVEAVSADEWDRKQWQAYARRGHCESRMAYVHNGHLERPLIDLAEHFCRNPVVGPPWACLPEHGRMLG